MIVVRLKFWDIVCVCVVVWECIDEILFLNYRVFFVGDDYVGVFDVEFVV